MRQSTDTLVALPILSYCAASIMMTVVNKVSLPFSYEIESHDLRGNLEVV